MMKIKLDKEKDIICGTKTVKIRNENKGQNELLTNLLLRRLFLLNGFNISPYLSGDTMVFFFLSFMFSSGPRVN